MNSFDVTETGSLQPLGCVGGIPTSAAGLGRALTQTSIAKPISGKGTETR